MLDRAIAHLDDGGEQAVKVEEICSACEVSITSLYHHFGSRDGLIIAAQAERFVSAAYNSQRVFLEDLKRAEHPGHVREIVEANLERVCSPDFAPIRRMRLQVLASAASRPELQKILRDAHAEQIAGFASGWTELQSRGLVRTEFPAEILGSVVSGLLFGRVHDEALGTAADTDQVFRRIVMAGLLDAVFPA